MTYYITITGMNFREGDEFMEKGMEVTLEKEPDNEYDTEAIKATLPGIGKIGYVANSTRTRIGDTSSAGRIYDKIPDTATAIVKYVMPAGVVCEVVVD